MQTQSRFTVLTATCNVCLQDNVHETQQHAICCVCRTVCTKHSNMQHVVSAGQCPRNTATCNMLCLQDSVHGTLSTGVCFISERNFKTSWSFVSLI
jgi:hypothetical protein